MADQNLKIQLTAIDKTRQAFASVAGGLRRVGGSIANVRTALVGLAAAAGLREFAQQIDDLAKASSRLGLTVNEIQSLQFAAAQTGASSEELEKGLTRFSRAISEASSGIGTGVRAFEALGVQLNDSEGDLRPTNELLNDVSDRLKQIKSPADRVRIAFDLFGRSGVNLVNTLQAGSGELGKLRDEFNAVTIELTGEQAEAVEKANDLFDKLGRTLSSLGQQITAALLLPLARVSEFIVRNLLQAISAAIGGLRDFLNSIVDLANDVGVEMQRFTFGEDTQKSIDKVVAGLIETSDALGDVDDSVPLLDIEKVFDVPGIDRANEAVKEIAVTFDEFGNKIGYAAPRVDTTRTALEKFQDAALDVDKALQDMAVRGLDRLEDGLVGVVQGTTSVKDAFKSMAASVINDLTRMYIRQTITAPLAGMLGGTSLFGGGKAIGGSVQRGTPYMVGERGPEMFVPNQAGSIIPNGQMGGGSVIVNQTINLSAGVSQTVRAEVMNMLPQIQNAAKGAVLDAKRRGGTFGAYV